MRKNQQRRKVRIIKATSLFGLSDEKAAELWRLKQAEDLLREAGYVKRPDGNWALPEERDS